MALTEKLIAIGDAIRYKTGESELIPLSLMPDKIRSISGEGVSTIETVTLKATSFYTSFSICCVVYVSETNMEIPFQFFVSPSSGEQSLGSISIGDIVSIKPNSSTDTVTTVGLEYISDYNDYKLYRIISGYEEYSVKVSGRLATSYYNTGKTFNSGIKFNS